MQFFHKPILVIALTFGVMLGVVDAFFDWMHHDGGEEPFLIYLVTDFPVHEVYWRGSFLLFSLSFGMIVSYFYIQKKESKLILDNIFENIVPICVTTNDYDIIMANRSYYKIFGVPEKTGAAVKCYDHRPGPKCKTESCPVQVISKQGRDHYTCESTKEEPNKITRTFIVSATPYHDKNGDRVGIIESFQDITPRKELEEEREQLIAKLNSALGEVKKLSGFLPICSSCKKVRDDKGYWKQIETYITERSGTEFSHSICPECAAQYYAKLSE